MTNDEIRLLWARRLAAEPLTPEEQRALAAALEDDAELRDALLDDLDLDGALRGLGEGRRRADAFNRTMADVVAPERDATRFIRKVEAALAGAPQKPPTSTKLPAIRDARTHRFTRRARPGEGDAIAWKVGLAAAAVFALVVVAAVGRPARVPSRPVPTAALAKPAPGVAPSPAAKAELENKRLRRLAVLEQEQARLEKEQPKPEEAPEDRALTLAELKAEREAIEAEMRLAIEAERNARPGPSAVPPALPERTPQGVTAVSPAREVANVGGGFVFATKPTVVQYAAGADLPEGVALTAHRSIGGSIQWKDGTRVELQAGAVFRVRHDEKTRRLVLVSGALDAQIARQPAERPMIFETPHSESTILGTTIRLTASPDASIGTTLEVREGRVKFSKLAGKSVEVAGGYFAVAASGAEPKASRGLGAEDEVRFVFGPADTRYDAARYKHDSGQPFDAARGYGWKSSEYAKVMWNGTPSGHVGPGRNTPSKAPEAQRLGHVAAGWGVHTDTWTMPIPNGRYLVTVGVGDWSVEHGPNRVTIEDKVVVNDVITKSATNHYAEFSAEIAVRDGELTMVCGGSESRKLPQDGSLDTILNYLVIRKLK